MYRCVFIIVVVVVVVVVVGCRVILAVVKLLYYCHCICFLAKLCCGSFALQVMPPVPVISTAAEHLHYGLNYHPTYVVIWSLIQLLENLASEKFRIDEVP